MCSSVYYYNFVENQKQIRLFADINTRKYFTISSGIGSTTKFLHRVSSQVVLGGTTFEKISEMYNVEHKLYGTRKTISADTIEESWLVFKFVEKMRDVPWIKRNNNHVDFKKICLMVYPNIKEHIDQKWLIHKCKEVGCSARMVVLDANEKLYCY